MSYMIYDPGFYCFLSQCIAGNFGVCYHRERLLEKKFQLKLKKFSLNTFDFSQIFRQRVAQAKSSRSYFISFKDCAGFLFVMYSLKHCVL